MCCQKHYPKHYYPAIGKLWKACCKAWSRRGRNTQIVEEMWLDRTRRHPGADPARQRQQSSFQQWKRVRAASNMETENKACFP